MTSNEKVTIRHKRIPKKRNRSRNPVVATIGSNSDRILKRTQASVLSDALVIDEEMVARILITRATNFWNKNAIA